MARRQCPGWVVGPLLFDQRPPDEHGPGIPAPRERGSCLASSLRGPTAFSGEPGPAVRPRSPHESPLGPHPGEQPD